MIKYTFYTLFILLFSLGSIAQDDTEEDTNSVAFFEEAELRKEKKYLTFKTSFIEALRQKGIENYNKALESLAICEEIYPDNTAMLFEQAKNTFKLKQYNEAHHYCDKALHLEPTNFWVLALSRDIYEKEQNYIEALKIQKELYQQKQSEARRLLKLYYLTKNKVEGKKLITEIDKNAIPISSIDFFKRYFFASTKPQKVTTIKKTVSKEKELSSLQKDFTKNKDFKILQKILTKELQSKQYKKLLEDSNLGLDLFPAQTQVYLYNGYALNGLAKYKEAVVVLETGLDYIFDDSELSKQFYTALINGYQGLNNSKKVAYYKQLVQKLIQKK
ncbi:MAG TPA: hypothetical protein EYG92_01660 [Lutibacter sp.]|nr:hypothetical protein [Lutibacter sp.]